jgi:hypothetical protein
MSLINTLVGPVTGLLDKFIEDKDQKAKLAHEIATMSDKHAQEISLAQIDVNKAEASSGSLFKGGWRPFVGWICGFALLYHFIISPLIIFVITLTGAEIPPIPEFDMSSLMTVLLGMLGIGGLRTYEKQKGLTK